MLSGHVDTAARYWVAGWAADTDQPDARIEIVVFVDQQEHGRVAADRPRADLQALGGYGDGLHGFRYTFDPPLSIFRSYDIVVRFARNGEVLTNGSCYLRADAPPTADRLRPIIVSAAGQPGATELMQSLAKDRSIIAVEVATLDIRMLSYYARALDVMAQPASAKAALTGRAAEIDTRLVGPNPYHSAQYEAAFPRPAMFYEFFRQAPQAALCTAFKSIVGDFYHALATHQGKTAAGSFVEQADLFGDAAAFARLAFGDIREIVLLQDPRDAYCACRDMWSVSAAQALDTLRRLRDRTIRLHDESRPDMKFVRTEMLRLQPAETLRDIAGFLSLDHDIASATPAEPPAPDTDEIGRWQIELNADEIALFDREFGDYLARFGYLTAAAADASPGTD